MYNVKYCVILEYLELSVLLIYNLLSNKYDVLVTCYLLPN